MKEVTVIKSASEGLEIKLVGEIAAGNAETFYAEVLGAYESCSADITFDCTELDFIDSTTLGTFVKIMKKMQTDGKKMKLKNLQAKIKKLFVICSLDTVMEIA